MDLLGSSGFQKKGSSNRLDLERHENNEKQYTLPGIMQYLQTQFTQVEKNRMQNDLEKSSLKLKIIELENERNTLKLNNEKLQLEVRELETKLLKAENPDDNNEKDTGNKKINQLASIDTRKLIKARNFLKTATDEIVYLLKSPTLDLEDTISIGRDDLYFKNSASNFDPVPNYGPKQELHDLAESLKIENPLADPFKIPSEEENTQLNDILSGHMESDAETIIDSLNDEYGINDFAINGDEQKENGTRNGIETGTDDKTGTETETGTGSELPDLKDPLLILGEKETSQIRLPLKLDLNPSELELNGGKLFIYFDKSNTVKVFDNLQEEGQLIFDAELPSNDSIVDIVTNEKFVVVATEKSLLVYSINEHSKNGKKPWITYNEFDSKNIDIGDNKILLVDDFNIRILEINESTKTLDTKFTKVYENDGVLRNSKFIKNNSTFDVVVLTSTSLILQKITEEKESKNSESMKIIPLSHYTDYLLTSKNLVIHLSEGLYLVDFNDVSTLKQVPTNSKVENDHFLGSCVDDPSMFYIISNSEGLELFKIIETGDILNIKRFKDITSNDIVCIGNLGGKIFAMLVAQEKSVMFCTI